MNKKAEFPHKVISKYDKVVPIEEIKLPSRIQRKTVNEAGISELANSIRNSGLIYPPIVYEHDGYYILVAGYRRFRAILMLKCSGIPVCLIGADPKVADGVTLVENEEREAINPVDMAFWLKEIMLSEDITQDDLARRLKRSTGWISGILKILKWEDYLVRAVKDEMISYSVAQQFADCPDRNQVERWVEMAFENGCSVRTARYWVEQWKMYSSQSENVAGALEPVPGEIQYVVPEGTCELCGAGKAYEHLRIVRACHDCYNIAKQNLSNH